MTLRVKTLLVVGLTMAVLVVLLFAASSWRMTGDFLRLEAADARQTADRLRYVVSEETRRLESVVFDLSARSSTYRFLTGANADFVETNLTDTACRTWT